MRFPVLRRPASLRAKMTLNSIAMLAVGLVVATCISLMGVKHYLVSSVDSRLASSKQGLERSGVTMRDISALARFTGMDRMLNSDAARAANHSSNVFVPVDARGRPQELFGQTPSGAQRALAEAVPRPARQAEGGEPVDVDAVHGTPYRATAVRLSDGQLVVMATEVGAAGEIMHKVIRLELVVGVALMAVLGTAMFIGSRRRLRPMEDMVEAASAIAEGSGPGEDGGPGRLDLSRRVASREKHRHHQVQEVERLRLALNAMLHQVEAAFLTREHAAAHLRRFVADASHELRTPLSAIRGYLQLYERGMLSDGEERARALARMTGETERMARLVDELLALARLDQRPELRPVPVDVGRLAEEALADLTLQQPERPVALELPAEPCVALADEATLRQVVGNLVANVRVHTPPSAAVRVEVTTEASGGEAADGEEGGAESCHQVCVLRVGDDGPGMSPEDAERVFDRFFRTGAAGTEGSGLGMSVVKAGVEAQHGTVTVTTAPGAGLTVTIALPAASRHPPPVAHLAG
ncbi:sensor histidine kinase [Streptomyces sp. NBC_01187]|uniref:sensor histidine kinase n=1 Tax=Streptomyces sp. NBC_01187 TaxID=2903766 RepID=UPI00386C8086